MSGYDLPRNHAGGWHLPSLRFVRERAGLSQARLAGRAGVSPSTVRRIERGELARYNTAVRLASVLHVNVRSLTADAPTPSGATEKPRSSRSTAQLRVIGGTHARITLEREAALHDAMTYWRESLTTPDGATSAKTTKTGATLGSASATSAPAPALDLAALDPDTWSNPLERYKMALENASMRRLLDEPRVRDHLRTLARLAADWLEQRKDEHARRRQQQQPRPAPASARNPFPFNNAGLDRLTHADEIYQRTGRWPLA